MSDFSKSELSDTEIMSKTTVERQPASGRLSLTFKLANGKEIVGTVPESNKAQGVITWCATVNETIRAEKAEERMRQRKLAAERKAALIVPPGSNSATPAASLGTIGTSSSTPAGQSLSYDPHAFVREQLKSAEAEWRAAAANLTEAQTRLTAAQNRASQWQSVAHSLGLGPLVDSVKDVGQDQLPCQSGFSSSPDSSTDPTSTPAPARTPSAT